MLRVPPDALLVSDEPIPAVVRRLLALAMVPLGIGRGIGERGQPLAGACVLSAFPWFAAVVQGGR